MATKKKSSKRKTVKKPVKKTVKKATKKKSVKKVAKKKVVKKTPKKAVKKKPVKKVVKKAVVKKVIKKPIKKASKPKEKQYVQMPVDSDGYISLDLDKAPVKGLKLSFTRREKGKKRTTALVIDNKPCNAYTRGGKSLSINKKK